MIVTLTNMFRPGPRIGLALLLLLSGSFRVCAQSPDPFANAPPPEAAPASRPARVALRTVVRTPPPRENPFPVSAQALAQLGLLPGKSLSAAPKN